jgi:formylglycine-generating enzyme required for sulfatase activity
VALDVASEATVRRACGVLAVISAAACSEVVPAVKPPSPEVERERPRVEASPSAGPSRSAAVRSDPAPTAAPSASAVVASPEPAEPAATPAREGMAQLAGGTYAMGESKQTVTVAPFALDLTEVTVDAYAKCVRAGRCSAVGLNQPYWSGRSQANGAFCNWGKGGKGNHPINCVDWSQATAYCQWAGKRLPTEPEWEWAARGQARGTEYPWGNDAPGSQACIHRWDSRQGTCVVGEFPMGDAPGGIHDLAGNVYEWTSTVDDGSTRVSRGGCWLFDNPSGLRAAYRGGWVPSDRHINLGFRCAR